MDVLYSKWTPKRRAVTDAMTIFCMIFYLAVLLIGGLSSTLYSLEYGQRNNSSWGPLVAPIQIILVIGTSVALPEMLKRGYDKRMVTGVIQAGSSHGIMVPPSLVPVLCGMIARQPVSQLWLAGVFAGLLLAGMFIVYIAARCQMQPQLGPSLPIGERQMDRSERFKPLAAGILPLIIIFSVTGLFMWIILTALCFGAVFDGLGAVHGIESLFLGKWGLSPWGVLMMRVSCIIMGLFLDDTALLVIVAPLYIPLVISLGFNPTWYGVFYTVTCQIAYMTPPFGNNLFHMIAMAPKEIFLVDIYGSIVPLVIVMLIGLRLVMLFPQIAPWPPETYYAR
jgi:TRAP-type mannitol/chloroaromatic compound transport system permease large subunit